MGVLGEIRHLPGVDLHQTEKEPHLAGGGFGLVWPVGTASSFCYHEPIRKALVVILCLLALVLPLRLRVLLCEAVGWVLQACYWLTWRITRFILKNLRE